MPLLNSFEMGQKVLGTGGETWRQAHKPHTEEEQERKSHRNEVAWLNSPSAAELQI